MTDRTWPVEVTSWAYAAAEGDVIEVEGQKYRRGAERLAPPGPPYVMISIEKVEND